MLNESIRHLEAEFGAPVLIYLGSTQPDKPLDDSDVLVIYDALQMMGSQPHLVFVLQTGGGAVTVARRIAMLLRSFTTRLTIVVPSKAHSAGSLLCLAADELVMCSLGELSPIDPAFVSSGESVNGAPQRISSEDVRALKAMSAKWFGVGDPESRNQLFRSVIGSMFPVSLSKFYRAELYVAEVGTKLSRYLMPSLSHRHRKRIVHQLIHGYSEHRHGLTRDDLAEIGIKVTHADLRKEQLLWKLLCNCHLLFDKQSTRPTLQFSPWGMVGSGNYLATYTLDGAPDESGSNHWECIENAPKVINNWTVHT